MLGLSASGSEGGRFPNLHAAVARGSAGALDRCGQRRAARTPVSASSTNLGHNGPGIAPMSGGSALRVLGSADEDLERALLDEWVIWQRARNVSDKTITEQVLVIRRMPEAATVTAVDVGQIPG